MARYTGFFFIILMALQACKSKHGQPMVWSPDGCTYRGEKENIKLRYRSLSLYAHKIKLSDSTVIERFYSNREDSNVIYRNGFFVSYFKSRDRHLNSETYQEVDSTGAPRLLDSFYVAGKGGAKIYFNHYLSDNLKLTKTFFQTGKTQSVLYYSRSGTDSLYREWYESGVLKTTKRFKAPSHYISPYEHYPHFQGILVENYEYYPNGVLAKKEKLAKNYSADYFESGFRKSTSYDTIINKQNIICVKKYYPNKKIRSLHFFQEEKPCHIWYEYLKEGVLVSSTPKAPVRKVMLGPHEPAVPELFFQVEENAEYPGGSPAFQKDFEKSLDQIYYNYPDAFGGKYLLYFEITKTGEPLFLEIKGFSSDLVKSTFKDLVRAMPRWKPSKLNGRAISSVFEVTLAPGT